MDCSKVTPVEECDCSIPDGGWCEHHQINKTKRYVHLCQTNPTYRRAWNECRGPLQRLDEKTAHSNIPQPPKGPGGLLRRALGCSRAYSTKVDFKRMDDWGIKGCRKRFNRIVRWLISAKIEENSAKRMLNIVLKKAEKDKK